MSDTTELMIRAEKVEEEKIVEESVVDEKVIEERVSVEEEKVVDAHVLDEKDEEKMTNFNLKFTPDIQTLFLQLCKENHGLFEFEENLKKIILDYNINISDVPDILVLVSKLYKVVSKDYE